MLIFMWTIPVANKNNGHKKVWKAWNSLTPFNDVITDMADCRLGQVCIFA